MSDDAPRASRRPGFLLLVLGLVALVVGIVLLAIPTPDSGWTEAIPISHGKWHLPVSDLSFLIGAVVTGAGLALVLVWVEQKASRRA